MDDVFAGVRCFKAASISPVCNVVNVAIVVNCQLSACSSAATFCARFRRYCLLTVRVRFALAMGLAVLLSAVPKMKCVAMALDCAAESAPQNIYTCSWNVMVVEWQHLYRTSKLRLQGLMAVLVVM